MINKFKFAVFASAICLTFASLSFSQDMKAPMMKDGSKMMMKDGMMMSMDGMMLMPTKH
jgi:hypothetical protein